MDDYPSDQSDGNEKPNDEANNSARGQVQRDQAPRPPTVNRYNVPVLRREEVPNLMAHSTAQTPSFNQYEPQNVGPYRRSSIRGYPVEDQNQQPSPSNTLYMAEVRTDPYVQRDDRSRSRARSETVTSGSFRNISTLQNQGNQNSPSVPPPGRNHNLTIPVEEAPRQGNSHPTTQTRQVNRFQPPSQDNRFQPSSQDTGHQNNTGIKSEERSQMRYIGPNSERPNRNSGTPREQIPLNSRQNVEPFPPFSNQVQMRGWDVNTNMPRGLQSYQNAFGSDQVPFSSRASGNDGMQQFLQPSIGLSPSQQYFQRERNMSRKKYVQKPARVPKKMSRFQPHIKVAIKEGVMADDALKVLVKRRAKVVPYKLLKTMSIADASDHLKRILNLHPTQGLWIEHLDTEDCLLWDLLTIGRKLQEAGIQTENVTIGMLAESLLFKSVTVYGSSGQHLLLKKTTPRDFEEDNCDEDKANSSDENEGDGKEDPEHPNIENNNRIKQEHPNVENNNGVKEEHPNVQNNNGVKEEHPNVETGGNNSNSTVNGNSTVTEDIYSPIIRDLMARNPEDVLLCNVPKPEPFKMSFKRYEPQMNGVQAQDHVCNLLNCGSKFEVPRGRGGTITVEVDRNEVLKSLVPRYKSLLHNGDLQKTLSIVFKNEPGMDFGGVTREFNSVLIEEAKKAGILEGNEVDGYTFIPKFSAREEIECVSYFLFKTAHCIKPLLPPIILAILFQKHLPENDEWVAALESLPSTTGSEVLTCLKVMSKMGIEELELEQPAVYISLQAECDMALGCGKLQAGMEKEIITTLFQFEICSRQLWLFNALRAGLHESKFLEFAEHHPSALALYSMEMKEFVLFEAEDIIGKLTYQTGSFLSADKEDENLAKEFLQRTLKMLEVGVVYDNKLEEKKLDLKDFCSYVTGAPHVVAVPEIEVQFTREEVDYFFAHVCNRQIDIPLGLEENVFTDVLLEKLSYSGFTTF